MSAIRGMDWNKPLTIVLHTPGGDVGATDSIVSYLRQKFTDVEVVVPTFAMSAGTMICLAANRLVMARHSQLGPIDPQMARGGAQFSARAVVEQFERARAEILADTTSAHVWAPILANLAPSLIQEAVNSLAFSERLVGGWLAAYAFSGLPNAEEMGRSVAHHFNDATRHLSHGRRIDRDEARQQSLTVMDLESDDALQEAVLTAYHLMTLVFERTPATKVIFGDTGQLWIKNEPGN